MENKENNPTTAACTVTEENDSKKDESKKDEPAKTSPSEWKPSSIIKCICH